MWPVSYSFTPNSNFINFGNAATTTLGENCDFERKFASEKMLKIHVEELKYYTYFHIFLIDKLYTVKF